MKEKKKGIGFLQTYPFSHYFYIDFSIFRTFPYPINPYPER